MVVRLCALALVFVLGAAAAAQDVSSLIADLQDEDLSLSSRCAVVQQLAAIGPDAAPAIPAVNALVARALDPKLNAQNVVLFGIQFYQQVGKEGVPQLVALANRDPHSSNALVALSKMGGEAKSAVPQLLKMIEPREQGEKSYLRCNGAMRTLAAIDPENADFHAALETYVTKYTEIRRPGVRIPSWARDIARGALANIQQIGPPAKKLVPVLIKFMVNEDLLRKDSSSYDLLLYPTVEALAAMGPEAKDALEPMRRIKAKGIPADDGRFAAAIAAIKAAPGSTPRGDNALLGPFGGLNREHVNPFK